MQMRWSKVSWVLVWSTLLLMCCGQGKEEVMPVAPAHPLIRPDLSALHQNIADDLRQLHRRVALKIEEPGISDTDRASQLGELGHSYFAHSFFDAAHSAYLNAHEVEPKNTRWLYYLGFAAQESGKNDKAMAWWKKLLDQSSFDFFANVRLGDLYADANQWEEAAVCYEKAQKVKPNTAAVYYGLGRVAAARGNDQQAVDYFGKTLSLQPSATLVNYPLGLAHRRLGNMEAAERFIKRRGNAPLTMSDPFLVKARKVLDAALFKNVLDMAVEHDSFDHKAFLGYVRSNLRGKPSMVKLLQGVAQQKVNSDAPDNVELARIYYAIGDLQSFAGETEDAIKTLAYGARLDPSYTELYLDLARTNLDTGLYDNTLKLLNSFLKARPDHVEARLLTASARIGKGDAENMKVAHADLNAILEEDTGQYSAHVLKARAWFQQNKVEAAIEAYEKVVAAEMPDEEKAEHYNTYARLIQEKGRLSKAAQLLEKSLQFNPNSLESKYDLASLQVARKRYKDAAALYGEVLEINDQLERAHLSRAAAWILAGDYAAALRDLDVSLSSMPNSVAIAHQIARLYAISPKASLRDPAKALATASAVYKRAQSALHAETLAMAFALNGKWDEAVSLQKALVDSARKQSMSGAVRALQENLARYQKKQKCCAKVDASTLIGRPQ